MDKEQKNEIEIIGHRIEKKYLYLIIAIIALAIILIVGACVELSMDKDEKPVATEQEQQDTEIIYVPAVVVEDAQYTQDKKDITAMQEENPDIYAWITIPGTEIDYPILQSVTNNYYLTHTAEGIEKLPGAIYTNQCNKKNFDDPLTVVYGHNMKDGSYFGSLHDFENREFFEKNREINIYTADRKITYKILAASTFSDEYIPDKYGVSFVASINNFMNDLKEFAPDEEGNNFSEDYEIQTDDFTRVLVLSTCVLEQKEYRYLVVAVKDKEELYEQ